MLDRSIPIREALVNSIPINEVKDKKVMFYEHRRHLILKNNFEPCLRAQFLKKLGKKNCKDFEFFPATFPLLGLTF